MGHPSKYSSRTSVLMLSTCRGTRCQPNDHLAAGELHIQGISLIERHPVRGLGGLQDLTHSRRQWSLSACRQRQGSKKEQQHGCSGKSIGLKIHPTTSLPECLPKLR